MVLVLAARARALRLASILAYSLAALAASAAILSLEPDSEQVENASTVSALDPIYS